MATFACEPVQWKQRRGYRLSNSVVELTVLTGGGHLVDFRLCGSTTNVLWEAPWDTIDPQDFSDRHIPAYGDRTVGRLLAGLTGHALVLGYFGMPSAAEVEQGLPLHGEAANSEWRIVAATSDEDRDSLILDVELPVYQLRCRREITLAKGASFASITETLTSFAPAPTDFQWVQHAAFGPPMLNHESAQLFLPAERAITWPLGYEDIDYLPNNVEFPWPQAPGPAGEIVDRSRPFAHAHTGFVVSVLADSQRQDAYAAVLNRDLGLVAGYHFDRSRFPWIALWEENRARQYAPWNGVTQVRGVEFGNTPMPLGLDQARRTNCLFETPVF